MGASSSRNEYEKEKEKKEEIPFLDQIAVDRLCREAYTAGAEDAAIHYQGVLESQWQLDVAVGAGGCAATLLLSYMYFSAQMAEREVRANQLINVEKSMVQQLQQESNEMQTRMANLVEANRQQQIRLTRYETLLRRTRQHQAKLRRTVTQLRQRGAHLTGEMNNMRESITKLNHHMTMARYTSSGSVVVALVGCLVAMVSIRSGESRKELSL
ncbi:uncharacterized protein TM35_000591150 [Trypanosoma theileri]|uniref:Uncharacterized protein n=1 Tax=Trypanosoma theileri TaxID=67003 RepID=A0A1X0NGY8_9TRYP|nr:uncharacterized protein TM35_000591150 [Trypanosoma theileri]ORC83723.1 hypothetical protein TM35_000591150 [Trypanosoma theileri]